MNNNYSNETKDRIAKLENLRAAGVVPYPEKFVSSHSTTDLANVTDLQEADTLMKQGAEKKISLAGRIISFRSHGRLSFAKVRDEAGDIQLCFVRDLVKLNTTNEVVENITINDTEITAYKFIEKYLDIADFVGVQGDLFLTKHGELTLFVSEIQLLTKSLLPLPEKFHGLTDEDTVFRKRYLDILLNKEVQEMVKRKGLFWNVMRDFLRNKGFNEVETPILEITTGGGDANPFATHHNAFDIEVFLRISAGELWQKRLMCAGLEKTFEIGRIFRNEGVSPEHAQDYTQMEVYWAYNSYTEMMQLMKELYLEIVDKVYKKRVFNIRGFEVDFNKEWEEIDYTEIIKEKTGIDIWQASDEEIVAKLKELQVDYEEGNRQRLVDTLWKYCRKQIAGPAFLVNEPKFMSPLAKSDLANPAITHRFHILIAGSEVGNGYSELNDPLDQKERFEEQQAMRDAGDDEAQMADWEFVEALMHGMPPVTGFGVSERLFCFLEDKTIRETQTFPLMKPLEK